jgi:hypothetical protein
MPNPYLQRRGDCYSFRIAVPSDLRTSIKTRELVRALNTSERRTALPRALYLASKALSLFASLRAMSDDKRKTHRVDYSVIFNFHEDGSVQSIESSGDAHERDAINSTIKTGLMSAPRRALVDMGQVCGKIIWEAKRAENWSDKWLQKLKDDQQEAKADIAVLVTTAMPKGVTESFVRIGDVWVVSPHVMRPVAETLRVILLEAHKLKLVNTGRNEKMESLYNYLASAQFSQKVRTMLESFESMRNDLEAEKRAMQKIWVKRQTQIERVTGSMVTVVGELQGIAHDSLPELDAIGTLALPAGDLPEEN